MLLIYSPEENPRVTWTFDILFRRLLGIEYRLTTFPDEIRLTEGPRLVYADSPIDDVPRIPATPLLFETSVRDQSLWLTPNKWNNLPTLFSTISTISTNSTPSTGTPPLLPFDLPAALFYLAARYEEYLPYEPDAHNRFHSSESLAFHLGFLEEPIVNQWAAAFAEVLKKEYQDKISIKTPDYQFISTLDIDNAWAYAHKGIKRFLGGLWQDRGSMEARNFRFQVLRDNQPDPYDTYHLIERFHEEAGTVPLWFFLLGDRGEYDKNVSHQNRHLRNLITRLSDHYPVGIHPSYASNANSASLLRERARLEKITGQPVTKSRHHYLRIHLPQPYRTMSHLGFEEDYTLGFADRPGFRGGLALPHPFFDVEENKSTDLMLFPFQVMDTCLRQYLGMSPQEALDKVLELGAKVRKTGGTFITLWHNESLSEWKEWTGWSEMYRRMLKELS